MPLPSEFVSMQLALCGCNIKLELGFEIKGGQCSELDLKLGSEVGKAICKLT